MKKEKLEYLFFSLVSTFFIILFLYVFFKYLFFTLLPFLIAWCAALFVRPISVRLGKITSLPPRAISAVFGAVSVLCLLTLFVGVLVYTAKEAWDFFSGLALEGSIDELIKKLFSPFELLFENREGLEKLKEQILSALVSASTEAARALVSFLSSFIKSVPRVLLFIIVTSVATVYFCLELDTVNGAVRQILPKIWYLWLVGFKSNFLKGLLLYLRSYLFLMLFTFTVLLFGFFIMKIPFAILLAFTVALVDALPLFGVGTVLIPWGIFELLLGSHARGIGLIVLFLLSWILRQFIEPKIVSKSLGVHPILSLFIIYLGYSFFGFMGLFLVPLFVVLLQSLKNKIPPPSNSSSSDRER